MERSKIIRYCERCRENIDNSNFKKYGNLCTICKVKQYYERGAKKFRRFLNTPIRIVISRVPNHTDLPISS